MHKAVFWDKDGTLIPDIPYNVDPKKITPYPDAGPSLRRLQLAGFRLIIVSNQAGIARGLFTEDALPAVWQRLTDLLEPFNVQPDAFYYCPHYPDGLAGTYSQTCTCRKPEPGMLLRAAHDYQIDLQASWMVGDILNDVEAGNRAGCRTILVNRGNETEWLPGLQRIPTGMVKSLRKATDWILQDESSPVLNQYTS